MNACCPACEVFDEPDACRYIHCTCHDNEVPDEPEIIW